jgi:PAS domain S-box-containing protein
MELIRDKGVLMVDLVDGQILFANNYLCDLLGLTPEDIERLMCFDLVFPEDMDQAKALFEANSIPNAEPFRFKLKRLNGSAIWVDVQGVALRPADGPVYAIIATVTRSGKQD